MLSVPRTGLSDTGAFGELSRQGKSLPTRHGGNATKNKNLTFSKAGPPGEAPARQESPRTGSDPPRGALTGKTDPPRGALTGKADAPHGALTVEAALTMGIFLLLCSLFMTFFQGQRVRLRLQHELDSICESVAKWSYAVSFVEGYTGTDLLALANGSNLQGILDGDLSLAFEYLSGETDLVRDIQAFLVQKGSALVWQEILRQWLIRRVGDEAWIRRAVVDGPQGLSLTGSLLQDRHLDLALSYRIHSPFDVPFGIRFKVVQRSCRHLWIGTESVRLDEEEETQEDVVYVTETGVVYHESLSCRVLAIHPRAVPVEQIGQERNRSGARYYACRYCAKKNPETSVYYITVEGIRYHTTPDCSELKRSVRTLHRSEAEGKYRPCSYCAQGDAA